MAAAFGLPVVVIFGRVRPGHLGPLAHGVGSDRGAAAGSRRSQPAQVIEALARLRVAA